MSTDITQVLAALRAQAQQTDQLRVRAETTRDHARSRLAEIDAQLRALSLDPDTAETQVAQMEAALRDKVEALLVQLKAEEQAYQAVLTAAATHVTP